MKTIDTPESQKITSTRAWRVVLVLALSVSFLVWLFTSILIPFIPTEETAVLCNLVPAGVAATLIYLLLLRPRPHSLKKENSSDSLVRETRPLTLAIFAEIVFATLASWWVATLIPAWPTQIFAKEEFARPYLLSEISEGGRKTFRTIRLTLTEPTTSRAVNLRWPEKEASNWSSMKVNVVVCAYGRSWLIGSVVDKIDLSNHRQCPPHSR